MQTDYLIIGLGLAGSLLAWELIHRGCSVVVVDNGAENASQIAAGLINPVTGMRFVKSADVETLLPAARICYSKISDIFKEEFFVEKPMLRIFSGENEYKNAEKRFKNPEYLPFIGTIQSQNSGLENLNAPFGFLGQKQTGYLRIRPLLNVLKSFFISRNSYRRGDFDYQEVSLEPILSWQDIYPRRIIFAEGYQAIRNPWFSWLPFQPVKGEILTLEHQTNLPDKILNYGNWLIPLDSRKIRIGATFDRENLNTDLTEQGKNELLNALFELSPALIHSTLIDHQANIRPGTLDRHPFIGRHPKYDQLAIFNGFGAKGSLQIPWYSRHFADNLLSDCQLLPTCNIGRYVERFGPRLG